MSRITVYGIPNCDTVKKARTWLADNGQEFEFHDFKKQGLDRATVARWLEQIDWETLVNRKGTTWRKLDPALQASVTDARSAQAVMRDQASVIKRPVVEWDDGRITVGFDEDDWASRA